MSATSRPRSSPTATPSIRTHFNVQHMVAAAYFARSALDIEQNYTELVDGEPYFAHRGYVTGAVLSAVASLETTINEVFIDAREGNWHTFEGVDPMIPRSLAAVNWEKIEKEAILRKYQKALSVTGKKPFVQDRTPYPEADSLIQLRHALVHYKPEWSTDPKKHKDIEDRLKGKFALNPFTGPNDAFFPKECLGHGCAEWVVKSGVAFIEEFFSRLGLSSTFKNYPQDLLRTR